MLLRLCHEFSQTDQRGVLSGHGRVAAFRTGDEPEVCTAFFADADHGKLSLCPADRLVEDHAALVKAHLKADLPVRKPLRNLIRAFAGRLLCGGG